jgi:hypothetical protein
LVFAGAQGKQQSITIGSMSRKLSTWLKMTANEVASRFLAGQVFHHGQSDVSNPFVKKIQPWNVAWFLTTWPSIDALFG